MVLDEPSKEHATRLTADIVAAYVANNGVGTREIPGLIQSVHASLTGLGAPKVDAPEKRAPAVSVKKSITPDYLISLEDGRRYKSLTRHLKGLGLTQDQYREKWGLARDYPMVAPEYAKRRSELAKSLGLGRKRQPAPPPPAPEPAPTLKAAKKPRASRPSTRKKVEAA